MSPEDAEAILALQAEIAVALQLADDEASYRQDWRIRYAAERVLERVFQAAHARDSAGAVLRRRRLPGSAR